MGTTIQGRRRAVRRSWAEVLVAAFLLVAATGGLQAAQAAVGDAPGGLTPADTTVDDVPVLGWDRVPAATSYEVQLSTSSSFSPMLASTTTTNVHWAPPAQLPGGADLYWQVRARFASGTSSAWSQARFHRGTLARPTPLAPVDHATVQPPDDAVRFRWSPVPGAAQYDVQVGSDPLFTDGALLSTTTVKGTSYTATAQQAPGTYYWRVRAQLATDVVSTWSDEGGSPWSYEVLALPKAGLVSPADDPAGSSPVQDVVLDWLPVPGAARYDLQLSTDQNFADTTQTVTTTTVPRITGTRYSPPATLDNDQYYWRVRPIDVSGNSPSWGPAQDVWHFRRSWPEQPDLQYPADRASVGDPFFFQWSPVHLASSYRLEVSTNSTFPATSATRTCTTTGTTYTPGVKGQTACQPGAAETYYWRVTAVDEHLASRGPTTQSILAQVHSFTYSPSLVTLTQPTNGSSLSVPTLRWQPLAHAARYRVSISPVDDQGSPGISAITTTTSFTPRSVLKPATYRWAVQSMTEDGRDGPLVLPIAQRVFTLTSQDPATAGSPEPTSPDVATPRFPTLTWTPVQNATRYDVRVRPAASSGWSATTFSSVYPAAEEWGSTFLPPGSYRWQVEAYNGATLLAQGSEGAFSVAPVAAVTDHRAALSGTALSEPGSFCEAAAPAECQNLRQTPVLRWNPVDNAGFYKLYVSRDAELTNLVSGYPVELYGNAWTPPSTFADSNAGSAYFWQVQSCSTAGLCSPLTPATHQFNLLSNPVQLLSPLDGVERPDDVTLTWKDHLDRAGDVGSAGTTLPTPARTEARYYHVQTSVSPQFTSTLDDARVDQTTFTSTSRTYPEGPIYWRVQAFDGSLNALSWSATGTFTKRSPIPEQVSPVSGEQVQGDQALSWRPLALAASYNLEVYRNDDTVPSLSNRVVSVNTKQVSYAPTVPLAASSTSYRWRVQRVDAEGRVGGWSALVPYTVRGLPPVQLSPAFGSRVGPNDGLFTWKSVDRAAAYRFERRLVGGSSTSESRVTPALAWAPTTAIAGGSWEWRVVALDSSSKELDASPWRGFTVVDRPSSPAPVVTGSGQVGTALTATAATWNLPDVTTTYQWYRGSTAIPGATDRVYQLGAADLRQSVKVRATGTLPGYPTATVDSNATVCGLGTGPTLAQDLRLTGTGRVGTVLSSAPVQWRESGVSTAYQWLVNGIAVSGATTGSFTVRSTDVSKAVQLRVTGTRTGYSPSTYTSTSVTALGPQPLVASALPKVSGIAAVGKQLTASPGTWPVTVSYSYQWLRDGAVISGATTSTRTLVAADAAHRLSVRVTARSAGYSDGTSTSAAVAVAKMTSATGLRVADATIRRSVYPKTYVTVTAPAGASITGPVSVYDGSRKVKAATLVASNAGKLTLTLPRFALGRHYVSVTYGGSTQVNASRSAKVLVTVRR